MVKIAISDVGRDRKQDYHLEWPYGASRSCVKSVHVEKTCHYIPINSFHRLLSGMSVHIRSIVGDSFSWRANSVFAAWSLWMDGILCKR